MDDRKESVGGGFQIAVDEAIEQSPSKVPDKEIKEENLDLSPASPEYHLSAPSQSPHSDPIKKPTLVPRGTVLHLGEGSQHYDALLWAVVSVLIIFVDRITDYLLMADFYKRDLLGSAAFLVVIHILTALIQSYMDWVNNGQLRWIWADILQIRTLVDFFFWCQEWPKYRGRRWANQDFNGANSFNTIASVFPSLIVQTYVIILDTNLTWIQQLSIVMSCLHALIDILHHFKYVSAQHEIWVFQIVKAIINTALRTIMTALLVEELGAWTWLCVAISYLVGLSLYVLMVGASRRQKREEPLKFVKCHIIFGNLVALGMMFASFPFAPNYSIEDWWLGYMVADTKIQCENALMMATVVNLWSDRNSLYYAGVFFAGVSLIANFVALKLLDNSIRGYFAQRGIYSDQLIVKLFTNFCQHYRNVINGQRAGQRALQELRSKPQSSPIELEPVRNSSSRSHGDGA